MSGIRVTYSGLINLVIGLVRILTGFAFILIITRSLSPEEFGTWNLLVGLITYVMVLHHIISFWVTREISRGEKSAKTAILSAGIFSTIGASIYIAIVYFVAAQTSVDQNILLFATTIIPTQFFYSILSAINLGWRPQATSYGLIIIDLSKIPVVLILLQYLEMGVIGVIIATVVANSASTIVLAILSRNKIKFSINKKFLKNWLKRSWLPLYPSTISIIFALDVLVFTIIVGSTEGVGYYYAALVIANMASYAGMITLGTYPKLLGDKNREFLQNIFTRLFFVLIPFGIISIVFAKPGLYALNPLYEVVSIATIFLTLRVMLFTIFEVFSNFLKGIEDVDTRESTFKDFIKSKLFTIPTLKLIQHSAYVGFLVMALMISSDSFLNLVLYWSIISFATQIPPTVIITIMVKRNLVLKLEYTTIIKYLIASIMAFIPAFLLAERYLDYTPNIFEFLPNLIFFVMIGVAIYLTLTYTIDLKTRTLFKAIINEVLSRK